MERRLYTIARTLLTYLLLRLKT